MNFGDVRRAINDAKETLRIADIHTDEIAHLLIGRLRKADGDTLARLKKELSQFNARTGEWKS